MTSVKHGTKRNMVATGSIKNGKFSTKDIFKNLPKLVQRCKMHTKFTDTDREMQTHLQKHKQTESTYTNKTSCKKRSVIYKIAECV